MESKCDAVGEARPIRCDTIYFINPANGAICEQFPDPTFAGIGQMAIDSFGRLFVGSDVQPFADRLRQ